MKKILILIIFSFNFYITSAFTKNDLYEKIDLFGEVIENITLSTVANGEDLIVEF